MKKKVLTEEDELKICDIYQSGEKGYCLDKIGYMFNIGKKRVKSILDKYNIDKRLNGGQANKKKNYIFDDLQKRFNVIEDGYHYVAKSKADDTIFDDYLNTSGCLTIYIQNKLGIAIPSQFKRRIWAEENGILWYEQFFDIIKMENINQPIKKCKYCDWTTVDMDNKSGAYKVHLKREHNIEISKFIHDFPEEKKYFSVDHNATIFKKDESNWVKCQICGKLLKRIDWRHLDKHGITLYDYKTQYSNKTMSENSHNILSDIAIKTNSNMVIDNKYTSKSEKEIRDFLISYNINVKKDRKILEGKEIDILCEDRKIAIEYNGIVWHSEFFGNKDKKYHLDKTLQCQEKGYRLIHIFENEYEAHKEIIFNKLYDIFDIPTDKIVISVSDCTIDIINLKDAKAFLSTFSLEEYEDADIHLGAIYKDKIVALMTFKQGEDELWFIKQNANDYNYSYNLVDNKILDFFKLASEPNIIIGHEDRTWFIGEKKSIFIKLGFKFHKFIAPSFKYINSRLHKFKTFDEILVNVDELRLKFKLSNELSNDDVLKKLGYDKLWNCGFIEYIWTK